MTLSRRQCPRQLRIHLGRWTAFLRAVCQRRLIAVRVQVGRAALFTRRFERSVERQVVIQGRLVPSVSFDLDLRLRLGYLRFVSAIYLLALPDVVLHMWAQASVCCSASSCEGGQRSRTSSMERVDSWRWGQSKLALDCVCVRKALLDNDGKGEYAPTYSVALLVILRYLSYPNSPPP